MRDKNNPEVEKPKPHVARALCIASLVLGVIGYLALRPIPDSGATNRIFAVVESVTENGSCDIFIEVKDHPQSFYINRGTERGLSAADLENRLVGQIVEIEVPSYWTPLDPFNSTRHISSLKIGDELAFSE